MHAHRLLLVIVILLLAVAVPEAAERWEAPPDAKTVANPVAATPAVIASGQVLYEKRCANCHGVDGRGKRGDTFAPADLGSLEVQTQTDGELFWKMTWGRNLMPAQIILVDEERWALVRFLRTLRR